MDIVSVFQLAAGVFWSATYVLIIFKGFRDKTPGMPMIAMCANLCWEFIFSFIYPHGGLQGRLDMIWLALDMVLLMQYVKYGRDEFSRSLPVEYFYPTLLLALALSFAIISASVPELNDPLGKYAAFAQNLMMSILFISMLRRRGSTRGQSVYIALFKMIGSLIPAVGFYLYLRSDLVTALTAATLLFDLIYFWMIFKQQRMEMRQPKSVTISG